VALVHHELCFGCGRTNLFGLLLEAERTGPDKLTARCFIKQDHQGADVGSAHEGILAAALSEAMALACGTDARAQTLELQFHSPAPVGTFITIEVSARDTATASAHASSGGRAVASAHGTFLPGSG
jgi:acyl-coenzyme A thioesterase PaaI-like protein